MTPMNLPVKQKQNRGHSGLVVTKREVVEGVLEWEAGVSRCKLLYIEWINNTILCRAQRTIFSIL